MDIHHLEYFSEVAKHLSFTKAALTLHVSQPSISKAIKSIEEELGVPLFYRSSKELKLTDAGKAVLVNTQRVLEAFGNLTSELSDIMEIKKGEIRVGIPPIVGASFFSKLISRFKERHPAVEFILTEVGSKKIKEGIEDGSLDIGLICSAPIQGDSFEWVKLLHDPLWLIVHTDHPISSKPVLHISDFKNEPFILYRKDFSLHDRIIEECTKHGFYPNVVCESSQKDFMVELVEAKVGVALLPSNICAEIRNPQIRAIPLNSSKLTLELGIIWKRAKYLPFAVREFVSIATQFYSH